MLTQREPAPAGMLLLRAIGCGGWCPRAEKKKVSEDALRRGRAPTVHRGCRRRTATVGAVLAARWLQDSSFLQSPLEAHQRFPVGGLLLSLGRAGGCWAQARTPGSVCPHGEWLSSAARPSQAGPLPVAAGLCCHRLLLCLLLTSWFDSKGLRMVKMIIQKFF